jgi:hypothetical protein
MQIHELTLHTKIDEGVLDTIKSTASNVAAKVRNKAGDITTPIKHTAQGLGLTKPGQQAASAGLLDPRAKLAAVKKNRDIVNLAQKFADEWVAKQPAPVSEAAPGAPTPAEMANLEKKIAAAAAQTPTQPTAQTAQYIKDFLAWANEKIAMRDPTTYQMIGLQAVDDSNNYTNELNDAKEAIETAMGDPVKTKDAVTRYLLTAIAGAQLLSSQNRVKGSKQVPAYGQAATQPARPGVTQAQAPAANTTGLNPGDINALMQSAGLPAQLLGQAGQKFQAITNNKILTSTGDRVADHLLRSMGYKVQ